MGNKKKSHSGGKTARKARSAKAKDILQATHFGVKPTSSRTQSRSQKEGPSESSSSVQSTELENSKRKDTTIGLVSVNSGMETQAPAALELAPPLKSVNADIAEGQSPISKHNLAVEE